MLLRSSSISSLGLSYSELLELDVETRNALLERLVEMRDKEADAWKSRKPARGG